MFERLLRSAVATLLPGLAVIVSGNPWFQAATPLLMMSAKWARLKWANNPWVRLIPLSFAGLVLASTLSTSAYAWTSSKSFCWSEVSTAAEGGPLTAPLSGYRLYVGTGSKIYNRSLFIPISTIQTPASPCVTILKVAPNAGEYFFAVTAEDTNAVESGYSSELKIAPPNAPLNFTVK